MTTSNKHLQYIADGLCYFLQQDDINHFPVTKVLETVSTGKLESARLLLGIYLQCWENGWDTYDTVEEFLMETYAIDTVNQFNENIIDQICDMSLPRLQEIFSALDGVVNGWA